jgi:large subunit ribosomal protein L18
MDSSKQQKTVLRDKRRVRVRKTLKGTPEKPRMCVIKTNQHIHVQLIDDVNHSTLASASTSSKEFRQTENNRKNKTSGKVLGQKIAEIAIEKSIKKAVFDRGCHRYHGILAAVADGAREAGLEL